MDDSIRLWDTLLSDPMRFTFTAFVCCALVSGVRDKIIDGDFACCMENLQGSATKVTSMRKLLNRANELANAYNTYETQYLQTDATSVYLPMLDNHM